MARATVRSVGGARVGDYISLGVIAKTIPTELVEQVLSETGRQSQRQRVLPAKVIVYYVIALGLYMQVSCREVLRWLVDGLNQLSIFTCKVPIACRSGITQARQRLGAEPIVRLHNEVVGPIGTRRTRGAYYRRWHLVSLDASTLDVADTRQNEEAFSRPGASRGSSAYPQIRFASLVENGTHVLFGSKMGAYSTGETTLAKDVMDNLKPGMLCLADRNFFSYELWQKACTTSADLLWRVKKNLRLECLERFDDGSYLSVIYPSAKDRRNNTNVVYVRVIEYRLEDVSESEELYRLMTTILDPKLAVAGELAALYHERWEIETALDELKTHLKGSKIVLRSGTPEMVIQEFFGLMMAHFAVRGLMHEAGLKADVDPDELSYIHSVRVVRRKLPLFMAFSPSQVESSARVGA